MIAATLICDGDKCRNQMTSLNKTALMMAAVAAGWEFEDRDTYKLHYCPDCAAKRKQQEGERE